MKRIVLGLFGWILAGMLLGSASASESTNQYARWKMGPCHESSFFPIAVWLQNPQHAASYRAAGINTYVALWRGPTEEQLSTLKQAGMKVICEQNEVAKKHLNDPTIIGWMHGDEPDNAQPLDQGKGYGPPIAPAKIIAAYQQIRQIDPTRPVMLNLGQGVAWDGWIGRGERTQHPEDYPLYINGGDIISFDIYPASSTRPETDGKLWLVAYGVERLQKWCSGNKIIWNCIECTRIEKTDHKPTPQQVRCEVWMSLIRGSTGIIYFVHEWAPKFNEAALLNDPPMLQTVTDINKQIQRLAPVINSPTLSNQATVTTTSPENSVALLCKSYQGQLYIFAVNLRGTPTEAVFTVKDVTTPQNVEVLDEHRTLAGSGGLFKDKFAGWDVHLYRLSKTSTTR